MAIESVKGAAAAAATSAASQVTQARSSAEPVRTASAENAGGGAQGAETVAVSTVTVSSGSTQSQEGEHSDDQERERRLKGAVQRVNEQIRYSGKTHCEFSYHEETNRISIKVLDAQTKEVIKEIPAEDTLRMVEKMWELAGILVDEKR